MVSEWFEAFLDQMTHWAAWVKGTRFDRTQVVTGLLGIVILWLGWQFDHRPDLDSLAPTVAPKYATVMDGYQQLLDVKSETPVDVDESLYMVVEMLQKRLVDPVSPITEVFVAKVVGTVITPHGIEPEPELTLEVSQANGDKQTLIVADLQAEIRAQYLNKPFRRGSMYTLIAGMLLELISIFWPAISRARKAQT